MRYALSGSASRPLALWVDGEEKATFTIAATTSWTTWTTESKTISLPAGSHTLSLKTTGQSGPNVDKLDIAASSTQTPVATLYFVHTDYLGTPHVVTDQHQSVVYMADYQPFGKLQTGQPNSIELYSRFPGQYLDPETGLYYNYFRDYDPSIGRYLQSDPIGILRDYSSPQFLVASSVEYEVDTVLADDLNSLYGYVDQNPVSRSDFYGLQGSCGPGMIYCNYPELLGKVTKDSLNTAFKNGKTIAARNNIRKVDELCDKFGGKAKDWVKKKGWDDKGWEWHWYEKKWSKIRSETCWLPRSILIMKIQLKNSVNINGLTLGVSYVVVGIDDQYYRVIDDKKEPILYQKDIFNIIDQHVPENWIKREYPDGEFYLEPPEFSEIGFFEDYFDGKSEAIIKYNRYLSLNGLSSLIKYPDIKRRT